MVNYERKRPILGLVVANPQAEEWLIGELQEEIEIVNLHDPSVDDLSDMDVDVFLIARKTNPYEPMGVENIEDFFEAAVNKRSDVIAIIGALDEEGLAAQDKASQLNIQRMLTAEIGESIDGIAVLNSLIEYLDEWKQKKAEHKQQAIKPPTGPKISIPVFGSARREPVQQQLKGEIIGVSSARGSGGTMIAWNLATALSSQGRDVILLNAGKDPSLAAWVKFSETRNTLLKTGEVEPHFGVQIGLSSEAMGEDEWVQAARWSTSRCVIIDLSCVEEIPLEKIKTLIHVRDCDPGHSWEPSHENIRYVLNRIPDGLPISAEDVLKKRPHATIPEFHYQSQAMWTGRPVVLEHPELVGMLINLVSEHPATTQREEGEPCGQFSLS